MDRCNRCGRILLNYAVCDICKEPLRKEGNDYICWNYRCENSYKRFWDVCDGIHKDWQTTLLLAIFLGWIGGHRFYVRKIGTGFLMLLLCWTGISFLWAIIDIIMIAIGKFEDKEERIIQKDS